VSEETGSFLARWSRRKAASQQHAPAKPPDEPPAVELPPIESLGPDSDFTPFLARAVPSAVQAQALRIAWASDPVIANFRGGAEYAWDFNAPGYGALAATDDVATLVSQVVRSSPQRLMAQVATALAAPEPSVREPPPRVLRAAAAQPALPPPAPPDPSHELGAEMSEPAGPAAALATADPAPAPAAPIRRHGGAMPV
jgi:hypothetical protein